MHAYPCYWSHYWLHWVHIRYIYENNCLKSAHKIIGTYGCIMVNNDYSLLFFNLYIKYCGVCKKLPVEVQWSIYYNVGGIFVQGHISVMSMYAQQWLWSHYWFHWVHINMYSKIFDICTWSNWHMWHISDIWRAYLFWHIYSNIMIIKSCN